MTLLVLALMGGIGAATRFAIDTWITRRWSLSMPMGTFVINVSGALFLGVLVGWFTWHSDPASIRAVLGTGFLGGYTTFSAACVEAVRLMHARRSLAALAHAGGMLAATVAAAALGLWLADNLSAI